MDQDTLSPRAKELVSRAMKIYRDAEIRSIRAGMTTADGRDPEMPLDVLATLEAEERFRHHQAIADQAIDVMTSLHPLPLDPSPNPPGTQRIKAWGIFLASDEGMGVGITPGTPTAYLIVESDEMARSFFARLKRREDPKVTVGGMVGADGEPRLKIEMGFDSASRIVLSFCVTAKESELILDVIRV